MGSGAGEYRGLCLGIYRMAQVCQGPRGPGLMGGWGGYIVGDRGEGW